jgi:hypothetical protein
MAQALSYAASVPWYRKRRWLPLLTLPILILGYTLALPQFRTLRQHQIRRTEIRQQFKTELDNARQALDGAQLDAAAIALLNAEFPIRTEQQLFWSSEVERCKKQVEPLRARLFQVSLIARAQADKQRAEELARRNQELEDEARQGIISHKNFKRYDTMAKFRDESIRALNVRAIELLRKGNNLAAFGTCFQIVSLDPSHVFDDQFWTSALPKP